MRVCVCVCVCARAYHGCDLNQKLLQDLLYKAVTVEAEKQKRIESLDQNFSLSSMSHKEREVSTEG